MAPRAPARNNDVAEDEERETLLPSGLAEPVTSTSSIATHPLESSSSKIQPSPSSEINLCRICLEEDTPDKLISPCSCSGTQKYAHHDCIQRWISEKGPNALRCEVCHSTYSGSFIVPPPAPPRPPQAPANVTMFLIQDPVTGQIQVATAGPRGTMVMPPNAQFLAEERERSEALATNEMFRGQRNPALSFLFSAVIFMLLVVMMHNAAPDGDSPDGGGGGVFDYPSMPNYPPAPPMAPLSPGQDVLAIVLFILTKIIFIGIPIWIIIRISQRQAERERLYSARANPFGANSV